MTNAAIFMHPDAYDTASPQLFGRHAAGESFLRGFLRHATAEQLYFWHAGGASIATLRAMVWRIEPTAKPVLWIPTRERGLLSKPGVLNLPGPNLDTEAWARRPYGPTAYSICGITHTTATARTMDTLSAFLLAPVEGHDALICTSSAVRTSVEAQLDGVRDYIASEYGGPRLRAEPQRVTIPLGVNVDDFNTSPEHRRAWRERLDIPADAVVALYVGRFNTREKMNPALMALALEKAAGQTATPIYWVNSGWPSSEADDPSYHEAVRALCPSVHYRQVDGRPPDVRFSIWSVADFFISFSDNIQETFGLTPVEAMAAGLPCIVTDWDGYRDTVRHGEDGFRIPTTAPGPGNGHDIAYRRANEWISYSDYVGSVAQFTAIDYAAAVQAICALADDPELRHRLGSQAQARACEIFDWSAIIPQYEALWGELNARRRAMPVQAPIPENPFRPDSFRIFAGYPTRHLDEGWRAALTPGMTWPLAKALLSGPLANYTDVNRPTLGESEQIVAWLTDRPGASVAEIAQRFPAGRSPAIARGLLWIARYGVMVLSPPG